jgi:uncharacterized protein (DUF58 family)
VLTTPTPTPAEPVTPARARAVATTRPPRSLAPPAPTSWFAALVALSGLALFAWPGRSWVAFLAIEAVLVAAFVADAVACAPPHAVAVQRSVPETLRVGDTAELAWIVDNTSERRLDVVVTDALWPSLRAARRTTRLSLPASARMRIRTSITPTRRGRFPLDEVTVRVTGPLRVAFRQARRDVPTTMRVMPAYPSRDEVRRRTRVPRVPDVGIRSIRAPGGGTEFDQLRDYRAGDDFRHVDWSSTMRLQRPIVRQHRTERNQNVIALLDNGRLMAASVGSVARVEHAMDAVLGVTEACIHMGDRVGLVTFDRQVRSILPPSAARAQLGRAAEAMYLLEPDLAESAYTAAFSLAAGRFRRRALYVVLTDLADSTVEQALVPALKILVRTHLVVVGAVRDPVVGGWARGDGPEKRWPSEAFRAAAAVAALQQRQRAAVQLRSAGAIVVDSDPGRLAVDLVDTYLTLKATGRL